MGHNGMHLMNAKQTAAFLQISYTQFWRIMSDEAGSRPPYVLVGAKKRFIREQVEKWLIDSQVPGTPPGTTGAAL